MTAAALAGPAVVVEDGGRVIRGLAVPFHQHAYVQDDGGDLHAEVFDEQSIAELPDQVPLLVGHRRDQPPAGMVRTSGITKYGLGVEAELIGSDDELEGWRRKLRAGLVTGLSIGFVADARKCRWEGPAQRGEPPLKRIRGAKIIELSLVNWPAYAAAGVTSLSMRSALDQIRHEESQQIIAEWEGPDHASAQAADASEGRGGVMATTVYREDALGRELQNPGTNAVDYLGRAVTATTDSVGRPLRRPLRANTTAYTLNQETPACRPGGSTWSPSPARQPRPNRRAQRSEQPSPTAQPHCDERSDQGLGGMMHPAYGWRSGHRQRRARLLPLAYGQPCPLCGDTTTPTQELHLDHTDPRDKDRGLPGDRIVHGTCNRRGLARLTPPDTNTMTIREW